MQNTIQLPLYFAPPIAWFTIALKHSNITLINDQKFPKQTYRNRFDYGSFQGVKTFSLAINGATKNNEFTAVEIDTKTNWIKPLIQTLKTTYGNSPFYEYYGYKFEDIINKNHTHLWQLNLEILSLIYSILKVDFNYNIMTSSSKEIEPLELAIQKLETKSYYQVFNTSQKFIPNLSILDLIFNEGPESYYFL